MNVIDGVGSNPFTGEKWEARTVTDPRGGNTYHSYVQAWGETKTEALRNMRRGIAVCKEVYEAQNNPHKFISKTEIIENMGIQDDVVQRVGWVAQCGVLFKGRTYDSRIAGFQEAA